MKVNRAKNKACSRCHASTAPAGYTRDATICDSCLEIKPKGQQRKGKKIMEPDEIKFLDCWGGCGIYN